MIAAGVNEKALPTYVGHRSITTTLDRYGHLFPGSEAEAPGLLDVYLGGRGRAHKGRPVKRLVADKQIRVIDLNGELMRELTLDPSHDYQPLNASRHVSTMSRDISLRCLETSQNRGGGIRTLDGGKPPITVFEAVASLVSMRVFGPLGKELGKPEHLGGCRSAA
jgi:hypothetical protein